MNNGIKKNYKESWLFFWKYYKKDFKMTIVIIITSILISLTIISLPFMTQLITKAAEAQNSSYLNMLIILSVSIIGIAILKIILTFILNYFGQVFNIRMEIEIRKEMMDKVHALSMDIFDNLPTGIFFARIVADLKEVNRFSYQIIENIISVICLIAGGFIYIFYINWIAGISVLFIYLFTLLIYIIFKNNLVYHRQYNKVLNTLINVEVGEHVEMISEIKSYNNSQTTLKKFDKIQDNYFQSWKKFNKKTALFKLTGITAAIAVSTVSLILGSFLVHWKIIDFPQLLGLTMAANILIIPIEKTSTTFTNIITVTASVVRIKEFMDLEIENNSGTIKKPFKGNIEFKDVTFSYNVGENEIDVLKNFNLKIEANQRTELYGQSNSGKTTIFKLLMRFYEPTSGEILIDGINIKDYDIHYLRNKISYQSFTPRLFSSQLEMEPLFKDTKKWNKIIKALEIENLFIKKTSLDNFINSQGLQLSDSEKQMLSIARALYFDTFIILFDHPDSHLDAKQINIINNVLNDLAPNKTIIFNSNNKLKDFDIDNYINI